jgi:3-isopropylmalate dehydrogenase
MKIAILPGDGIGKEITAQAVKALHAVGEKFGHTFETTEMLVGWAAIDQYGEALPEEIYQTCLQQDAIYLGAVGLPERDNTLPMEKRPERAALLKLRGGNYANLRPIWRPECMATPARPAVDLLIVRELSSDIYMGGARGRREVDGVLEAYDTMRYSVPEIERIAHVAFQAARLRSKRVCSIDKANILMTSALWRETVERIAADYPDVTLRHQLVDSSAPALIERPQDFDVVLTPNLFGDILSDLCAVLAGSLGMLPSASIGGQPGFYEPAHGSAPDIAGKDMANPIAAILSMAMLLEFAFQLHAEGAAVRQAVLNILQGGYRTGDIMAAGCTKIGTTQFGDMVVAQIVQAATSSPA